MIEWKSWIKDLIESYPIKNKNEVIEGVYTFYNTIKLLNPNYDKTVSVSSLSGGTKHSIEFLDKNKVSLGSINLVANDLKDICLEFSVGGKKLGISCTDEGVAQSYVDTPVGEECHQIVNIEYLSATITAWYNKVHTELYRTIRSELINAVDSQIKANIASIPTFTGIIVMWSGSVNSIPSGWHLCDGSNGTPDLRNRFIIGAGASYNPSTTGGSSTYSIGDHYHVIGGMHDNNGGRFFGDYDHKDSEIGIVASICKAPGSPTNVGNTWWNGSGHGSRWNDDSPGTGTVNGSCISSGPMPANVTTSAGETLPPYYALCFIMRL